MLGQRYDLDPPFDARAGSGRQQQAAQHVVVLRVSRQFLVAAADIQRRARPGYAF
jgi:hypothetical protein